MTIVNAYLYRLNKNGEIYSRYSLVDKVEKNSVNAWAKKFGGNLPYGYIVKTTDYVEVVESNESSSYNAIYFIGEFFKEVSVKLVKNF